MSSITEAIKAELRKGNMIVRLIAINVGFFIVTILIQLGLTFYYQDRQLSEQGFAVVLQYIAAPFDITTLLFRPWTLITSIFLQYEVWHLVWNMVFLFWFGKILQEYVGSKKILPIYIYGGLCGYFLADIFFYLFPQLPIGGMILGASGAVYAIMIAMATLAPNYVFHLMFIGPVRVKYIVAVRVLIDLMSIANMENMGGHIAHIGGGLLGFYFIMQSRKNKDLSKGFYSVFNALIALVTVSKKRKVRVTYRNPKKRPISDEDFNVRKKTKQEEIDIILDKISKSGYEGLSKSEKDKLFKYSNDK